MRLLIVLLISTLCIPAFSQDDLLKELLEEKIPENYRVEAVFKGTRIIHGHSVKLRKKGELEMLISHRFGRINSGAYNLFGLDDSQIRLGFDYGISDRLNIGIGRSSFDKTYDGFLKYSLIEQKTLGAPFSVVGLASGFIKTSPPSDIDPTLTFSDRVAYTMGVMIARKFSSDFTLQLMPVWVHKNSVTTPDINDLMALGSGFRYKITQSISINGEYYLRLNAPDNLEAYNSVALGLDIETGGHVFQLHISNSRGMMERSFVSETTGNISDGDIHFGFNISRTFQLASNKR